MSNPNDLIKAAKELLGETQVEECPAIPADLTSRSLQTIPANSSEIIDGTMASGLVSSYEPTSPPMNVTTFQKFGDLPTHLREGEGINLVDVRKLNLAVAVEALERAATAHENFPSPDAGFAVAGLSEQILKLTKDLEKSFDPNKILDELMDNVLTKMTKEIVQDLMSEMKKLREETMSFVRVDKQETFDHAFKIAVNRMGPALKERLDVASIRIARVLNVKETPHDRSGS
jgi:hypothetical protein